MNGRAEGIEEESCKWPSLAEAGEFTPVRGRRGGLGTSIAMLTRLYEVVIVYEPATWAIRETQVVDHGVK